MYWVYILENSSDKSWEPRDRDSEFLWYIGYTSDLKKRLAQHQKGDGARTTKRKTGWKLIYCEGYLNQADAKGRERFLKSGSGRRFLKKQLTNYLNPQKEVS